MGSEEPSTRVTNLRARRSDARLVPTFTMLEGPEVGAFYAFDPGRRAHRLGRAEDADIRVSDPSVSRVHAICIVASREGRLGVRIQDNGSTNGVLVNGKTVAEQALISGDKVRLGDILLRFEWMAEEEVRYHSDVSERVRQAERDHLTGLLTRAFLSDRLPKLLEDVDRRGQPISCVLLDLDHFKAINDVHGHLVGDQVIQRVAETMTSALRETDSAIRYGGEELLVVMPGLEVDDALQVATRVGQAVRDKSMFDLARGLSVTASIGVAMRGPDEPWAAWVNRADRALYAAKADGRDRVVVAESAADAAAAGDVEEQVFLETLPRSRSFGPITDDLPEGSGDA